MKKVLNVGGGNKHISLPKFFKDWQHDLLDIDPRGNPDICCDARLLKTLEPAQYDAVYCSHNLEHYYLHEVPYVLDGFAHITKDTGMVWIATPNLMGVINAIATKQLEPTDVLYRTSGGFPIMAHDIIFGWGLEIQSSGQDFYAHKCGFSINMLKERISKHFPYMFESVMELDLLVIGFKQEPSQDIISLVNT